MRQKVTPCSLQTNEALAANEKGDGPYDEWGDHVQQDPVQIRRLLVRYEKSECKECVNSTTFCQNRYDRSRPLVELPPYLYNDCA